MVDQDNVSWWGIEEIPDEDRLYLRVHRSIINRKTGEPMPIAFSKHEGGMSVDWTKYSTPVETQNRVPVRKRGEHGVVEFEAARVRAVEGQMVEHTPEDYNLGHSDVFGPESEEVRRKLSRICTWVIKATLS